MRMLSPGCLCVSAAALISPVGLTCNAFALQRVPPSVPAVTEDVQSSAAPLPGITRYLFFPLDFMQVRDAQKYCVGLIYEDKSIFSDECSWTPIRISAREYMIKELRCYYSDARNNASLTYKAVIESVRLKNEFKSLSYLIPHNDIAVLKAQTPKESEGAWKWRSHAVYPPPTLLSDSDTSLILKVFLNYTRSDTLQFWGCRVGYEVVTP